MLLRLVEENWPLDYVVFYNTGMEFDCIYNIRDKVKPILQERGISYVELNPKRPFLYSMLEKKVCSKQKGRSLGIWLVWRLVPLGNIRKITVYQRIQKKPE